MSDNDLIRRGDALAALQAAYDDSGFEPDLADADARIAALPAVTVGVRPDAAEVLAKEMQAIVAADRWKGRDLNAAPPEKWSRLRPETQQFWVDTAARILAALGVTPAPLRYMGQIMAECDCPREAECQAAGRCIAEGRR